MSYPTTYQVRLNQIGLAGRLLVAMPNMQANTFAKSVVLVCQHDRQHALGVILNKPIKGLITRNAVKHIGLEPAVTAGALPIFFGGPCETKRGFVLHTTDYLDNTTITVGNTFGLTSNRAALERLRGDQFRPNQSRVLAGYAGWSSGQLDSELRRQAWLDIPATRRFVFGTPVEKLWSAAIAQLGVPESSLWVMGTDPKAGSRPLN